MNSFCFARRSWSIFAASASICFAFSRSAVGQQRHLSRRQRASVLRIEGRFEDRPQPVEIGLRNRIMAVIVALRTADRHPQRAMGRS
jgi:hypothetical protein